MELGVLGLHAVRSFRQHRKEPPRAGPGRRVCRRLPHTETKRATRTQKAVAEPLRAQGTRAGSPPAAVWQCGCAAVWQCGCVAVRLCGSAAVRLCGCVASQLEFWQCGCVAVRLCGSAAVRLCGCVASQLEFHTAPTARANKCHLWDIDRANKCHLWDTECQTGSCPAH